MENNELQHHGTKGMKWGQRLYQNKDGSLTALGRARMKYKKRAAVKKREATIKAKKKTAEEVAKEKEQVLKSRSAKELYDKAPLFNDAELRKAYDRLVLEKNIKDLQPKEVSKGKQFVTKAIETGDTIAKAMGTLNKITKIGKSLSGNLANLSDDGDGVFTGKVFGEGTSKGSYKPKEGPIIDADFVETSVTNFVDNHPALISAGQSFVAGYLEKKL